MSNAGNYASKLDVITSIPDKQIKIPVNIPVYIYIQEAEDIRQWCQSDKDKLIANGLDWSLVEDLPARIGTLRQAQSLWNASTDDIDLKNRWREITAEAHELRQHLIRSLRFVFRNDTAVLPAIKDFTKGRSHATTIQSLNDLSVFGEVHIESLQTAGFDISALRRARELSMEMTSAYAVIITKRNSPDRKYKIRNQAYTHLAEAIDEIKRHAKHVLFQNHDRLRGYSSEYISRKNRRYKKKKLSKDSMIQPEPSLMAETACTHIANPSPDTLNQKIKAPEPETNVSKPKTNSAESKTNTPGAETNRLESKTDIPVTKTNQSEKKMNKPEWSADTILH